MSEDLKNEIQQAYENHFDELYRYLRARIRSNEIAEDIVQETFLKLFRYRQKKPVENVRAFLFRTAKNSLIDFTRKHKKEKDNTILTEHADLRANWQANVEWQSLQRAIKQKLNSENALYVELFLLRVDSGLTYDEIVEVCQIPRRSLFRHFDKIKTILYENFGQEIGIFSANKNKK